jgi:hypothetical protein
MNYIIRKTRSTFWLIKSFTARYKRHVISATLIGGLVVFFIWHIGPRAYATLFPTHEYIGIIGQYEPTKLP